ncbi:ABC transporter permease [uncultured Enterovirga sp.]|uniref:ABC transporter permease n=1 Tax=uncultured Enterovirga sp. TaxID=2026352 RepID=UPI0035CB0B5B
MTWTLQNYDTLFEATLQHLLLVGEALAISLLISLPLGIVSARRPRLYGAVILATGLLYTVPALALFALLVPVMGLGDGPALVAIVMYSLLVLTRNVAVALRGIPADILDAADGMGFGRWRRLLRIELPLAAPVILAGIRLTVVTQISVATVAAFIGAGGLGDIIFQGITQDIGEKVVAGAAVASALAVAADEVLRRLEKRLRAAGGLAA